MRDESGSPLAGVVVEASGPRVPAARATATDSEGRFRLLRLPAGDYRIRAILPGFLAVEEHAAVTPGVTRDVRFVLKLFVEEAVGVSGQAARPVPSLVTPRGDPDGSTSGRLPLGRSYIDLVLSSSAITVDRARPRDTSLALAVYGAIIAENEWILDGFDVTDARDGSAGKALRPEFLEGVELQTDGVAAEFGRALGGVVNVMTKSGGNQFHGDVFGYFDSSSTTASRTVASADSKNAVRVESSQRLEGGADLGGFLLRDRLWFFAAYDRTSTPGAVVPVVATASFSTGGHAKQLPRDQKELVFGGKLTGNLSDRTTIVVSAFSDPLEIDGAARVDESGAFLSSLQPGTWESKRRKGAPDYGARIHQLFGSSAVLTLTGSRHHDRFELVPSGTGDQVRVEDWTCAGGTSEDPCEIPIRPNSVSGGFGVVNGAFDQNSSTRDQYRVDLAFFPGGHEFKLGVELEQAKTRATTSITGGQLARRFNDAGWTYFSHDIIVASPDDLTPTDSVLTPRSRELAIFAQDSWKISSNWTVNAGLRWDEQDLRNYAGRSVVKTVAEWQPRLFVVWDPGADGKMKVYVSAGRFYYALPTSFSLLASASTTVMETYNYDSSETAQDPTVPGHETPYVSVRGVSEPVDSGLRGIFQDELTLGVEKLVASGFTVGLKGTYRRLGQMIEERCDLDYNSPANNYSSCAIINPGSSRRYAQGRFRGCNGLEGRFAQCQEGVAATPPARRLYRGIEISGQRSFGERLWLEASYSYSSLRGNEEGILSELATPAPFASVESSFQYPLLYHNAYGRLPLDRPHKFRSNLRYSTPSRLFVGLSGYVESGAPLDQLGYFAYGTSSVQLVPRGSAGRMPTLWDADLTLGWPIAIGPVTVTAQAYVFSLFNHQAGTLQDAAYTTRKPPGYPTTIYNPQVPPAYVNADYGKVLARAPARTLRAALKISF